MIEFVAAINWGAILQIILIDILLGGDNAVVIALACKNLPREQRRKGILWGTAGAIILRLILISFAVVLLEVPFLKLIGGVLLLWIGVKLMLPSEHPDVAPAGRLSAAIRTIIVADLVMSLDNVIAIAGAAEGGEGSHRFFLVAFGLLLSVPLIVFGSQLVLKLLDRYPIIVIAGAGLLGWIGGGLIASDRVLESTLAGAGPALPQIAAALGALLVISIGLWRKRALRKAQG